MAYKIVIIRVAQKQVLALPRAAQIEIAEAVDSLAKEPRPARCRKLKGTGLWRLRIGHYRVVYDIDSKSHQITILKVAIRREDTYEGL